MLEPEEPTPSDRNSAFDFVPPTPAEYYFDNNHASPRVRTDSWENIQSSIEQVAEEMAEEDLMRAGKRSGLFGGSYGGSATSTFPFSSNLTPSLISIESCDSGEDRVDGNDHYKMATGGGSDVDDKEINDSKDKSPRQLEFSSNEDRAHKTNLRNTLSVSPFKHHYNARQHDNVQKYDPNNAHAESMYHYHDKTSDLSNHASDFHPPSEGSSVVAHTGHSADNVVCRNSSCCTPRRRVRRFGMY
ncbi:uncharacterized protein BCR38DRAFT_235954 [Pseudomassariella vexata]|uniref:Uncharacterized protein n=1 Tax=Pseudomassariella vexata TaxID=1141098 RepID=A0A1Y2DSL8_9PEZI|nr:uncharacterized protein BCR38DRAFT_235954 [Pseudomassariella vexata]ORY62258.1 hypothetical protein BCR38DRAFT_235954 [Pseudomassariella vexata]